MEEGNGNLQRIKCVAGNRRKRRKGQPIEAWLAQRQRHPLPSVGGQPIPIQGKSGVANDAQQRAKHGNRTADVQVNRDGDRTLLPKQPHAKESEGSLIRTTTVGPGRNNDDELN
ncbi:hypothetical protein Nepgr_003662 [Nepenthes gracilis]|uniref:Uncharacterized protein n=1 Tax=Nepenthes gracilis TaxID=150966 RepID=A0AAD3RZX6_NEPGR|nr:hypothetical protein Nepgr_003662 [Nepenthes gracilis]